MTRRGIFTAAVCALVVTVTPVAAEYPERQITLVVPFAAGGPTDAIARIVADHMAKTLGQPIVIENDAGAGGTTPTSVSRKRRPTATPS